MNTHKSASTSLMPITPAYPQASYGELFSHKDGQLTKMEERMMERAREDALALGIEQAKVQYARDGMLATREATFYQLTDAAVRMYDYAEQQPGSKACKAHVAALAKRWVDHTDRTASSIIEVGERRMLDITSRDPRVPKPDRKRGVLRAAWDYLFYDSNE